MTLNEDQLAEIDADLTEVIWPATAYFSCPYFRYSMGFEVEKPHCQSGCYTEPACTTNGDPLEYAREIRDAAQNIVTTIEKSRKNG